MNKQTLEYPDKLLKEIDVVLDKVQMQRNNWLQQHAESHEKRKLLLGKLEHSLLHKK